MSLTEFPIRTRDVRETAKKRRVTRRWWCLSTDVTKGEGGWTIAGLPKFGEKLNIPGMTFRTNETPVCVMVKAIPRLSEKRGGAFAIFEMSRQR